MFKLVAFVLLVLAAVVRAEPKPSVLAYSAPVVAAAPSAAIYSREYHGNFAAPYVAAPYFASPYAASPYVAAPYVASPYAASPYFASPYAPAYTAPLLLKK
ncbi:PREDICTED: translation initiation factor IF-2 [Rhagoletis zephyria]|uniref:translation initiation factor IF-2 n=1 Tax=Rhagoletis zephyria TaxID=28612 RepID=UPI000811676B|nr:PREDICTED: translation initiation factor IF-2 [Rhagoletis zephyria]